MVVTSTNAELVTGAAVFIAMAAAPAYLVWGLISPRSAMFWAKRWGRLWVAGLTATLFMLGIGMEMYATQHTPGVMIAFGGVAIWLIARSGTLPARTLAAALPAAGHGASPQVAAQMTSFTDAEIAAIRDKVPAEQRSAYDTLYDLHKSGWSLKGKDEVAHRNIDLAHQCAAEAARIWTLKNGPLPTVATTLSLAQGEQCVWKGDCRRLAYVTVQGADRDELREVDDGNLYLTTQRLIFVGRKQNFFLDIGDIQTLTINDEVDIAIGRARGENLNFRSNAIKDPFDPRLTGPFEILWGRVRG